MIAFRHLNFWRSSRWRRIEWQIKATTHSLST
jgi:hypothetical protein